MHPAIDRLATTLGVAPFRAYDDGIYRSDYGDPRDMIMVHVSRYPLSDCREVEIALDVCDEIALTPYRIDRMEDRLVVTGDYSRLELVFITE